jgi:hypothetical protein
LFELRLRAVRVVAEAVATNKFVVVTSVVVTRPS